MKHSQRGGRCEYIKFQKEQQGKDSGGDNG